MNYWRELRAGLALLLAVSLACAPAHALVTLNDSHDHIFVTGTFGVSHDSNIFASQNSAGDFVFTEGLTAEYTRRAGWIGVNATVAVGAAQYGKLKTENYKNPSYSMELTKQSGRTTGSFTLSGARESRADSAINIRSNSWNYATGLNFKYPVNERFTVSGSLNYASRKYIERTNLANLSTYAVNTDVFYILTNERDLVGGYRYRYSQTSKNTSSTDQAVTAGVSGRVITGINGSFRVGYQTRTPHGNDGSGKRDNSSYSGLTASSAVSYSFNRKLSLNGTLSKDYSTTATDTSTDSTTAGLDLTYAYSAHWNFMLGSGWGDTRFLGEKGRIVLKAGDSTVTPPIPDILGVNRHDNYATWSFTAAYSLNEHFKVNFAYSWFENWSTVAFADFIRNSWSVSLSSRW